MKHLRRSMIFLNSNWPLMLLAIVSLVTVLIANLLSPQYIQSAIDQGITPRNLEAILAAVRMLLLLAVIRGISALCRHMCLKRSRKMWPLTCATASSIRSAN